MSDHGSAGLASAPMALRLLYVMDPMSKVLVDKDTTFVFMLEGERRGHEQYHCLPDDLFVDRSRGRTRRRGGSRSSAATPHLHAARGADRAARRSSTSSSCARTRRSTWPTSSPRISSAWSIRAVTFVMNDPRGLRDANEKLYALNFPDVIPPSLVTARPPRG